MALKEEKGDQQEKEVGALVVAEKSGLGYNPDSDVLFLKD